MCGSRIGDMAGTHLRKINVSVARVELMIIWKEKSLAKPTAIIRFPVRKAGSIVDGASGAMNDNAHI